MAGGRIFTDVTTVGDVEIYNVTSDPSGALQARVGSIAIQSSGGSRVWQNQDGATSWSLVASTAPRIIDGDGDTGISAEQPLGTDTDALLFVTAAQAAMVIDPTQQVGIGTVNPQTLLHVRRSGDPTQPALLPGHVMALHNSANPGDQCRIAIIADSTGSSLLDFGDPVAAGQANIEFDHSLGYFTISIAGSNQFSINGSGGMIWRNKAGTVEIASSLSYVTSVPAAWAGPIPTTVGSAINRIAGFVSGIHGPI